MEFQLSHIDRMPLGNLAATILTLVVGSPEVHWIFTYTADEQTFVFDEPADQGNTGRAFR